MTRKVAIFYGADFLITIHRTEQPFLTGSAEKYEHGALPKGSTNGGRATCPGC